MGKRTIASKFPVARIKKIMQADEDVGKVAQATPVVVSKALEQFLASLVAATVKETAVSGSRKVSTSHLKRAVHSNEMFDFCKDRVENVPDVAEPEKVWGPFPRRRAAPEEGGGRSAKRARTTTKKVKKDAEDDEDDLVTADEDEEEQESSGKPSFKREEDDDQVNDDGEFRPSRNIDGGGSVPIGNMIDNETPALMPNFSGGGMISHSPNYIPPGGPISSPNPDHHISNLNPSFGNNSSSSSIFNPIPEPASAPASAPPPPAPKPTSTSTSSWASKPRGLPPPRFTPGGNERIKHEN